jgi:hypothetical protein
VFGPSADWYEATMGQERIEEAGKWTEIVVLSKGNAAEEVALSIGRKQRPGL